MDTRIGEAISELVRPHYLLNPSQLVRRLSYVARPPVGKCRVRLAWGHEIVCDPNEHIGLLLVRRGVFDLLVCEMLLRLADTDETALDVGANFGQMTSLLAYATGQAGRVIAFEPHPDVFSRLSQNAAIWAAAPATAPIELHQAGLSDSDGMATLSTDVFERNQGAASLEPTTERRAPLNIHAVPIKRLDSFLGDTTDVGVMKIDIEGHELRALCGALRSLSSGRIRDIVFEERVAPPTPVTELLKENGYTVMQVDERTRGLAVSSLGTRPSRTKEDVSLLATLMPERAIERLRLPGWAVYGLGPARCLAPSKQRVHR